MYFTNWEKKSTNEPTDNSSGSLWWWCPVEKINNKNCKIKIQSSHTRSRPILSLCLALSSGHSKKWAERQKIEREKKRENDWVRVKEDKIDSKFTFEQFSNDFQMTLASGCRQAGRISRRCGWLTVSQQPLQQFFHLWLRIRQLCVCVCVCERLRHYLHQQWFKVADSTWRIEADFVVSQCCVKKRKGK